MCVRIGKYVSNIDEQIYMGRPGAYSGEFALQLW